MRSYFITTTKLSQLPTEGRWQGGFELPVRSKNVLEFLMKNTFTFYSYVILIVSYKIIAEIISKIQTTFKDAFFLCVIFRISKTVSLF